MPVLTIVAAVSVFLPFAVEHRAFRTEYLNYFHEEMEHNEGYLLLGGLAIVLIFGALALFLKPTWVRITTAVVAILVGGFLAADGVNNVVVFTDMSDVTVGVGAYVMGISGVLLVVAAILTLLPSRKKKQQTPSPMV